MKSVEKINKIEWSDKFAYGVGLITSDGSLSKDGRHITFVSKDREQVESFMNAFDIKTNICLKSSGSNKIKRYFYVQFSNVFLYRFLNSIGIFSAKSKTISSVIVPKRYFPYFLRGLFDGDGYTSLYKDKRWKNSIMFYLGFTSASKDFIQWLRISINKYISVKGHISKAKNNSAYSLRYGKKEAVTVIRYFNQKTLNLYLKRKSLKIIGALKIIEGVE